MITDMHLVEMFVKWMLLISWPVRVKTFDISNKIKQDRLEEGLSGGSKK